MPSVDISLTKQQKEFLSLLGEAYLRENKPEKAVIVYQALWALFPQTSRFVFCLAQAFYLCGQYDAALESIERYIIQEKDNPSALGYLLKGRILVGLGSEKQARDTFERYFQLQSDTL